MYLFNAKIENPEKLEQMLVGREHIVKLLEEAQLQKSNNGIPPQYLVVGPRGSGKTHMLRVIYDRLSKNDSFMALHEIAYMVEDETGIANYFDLLQRMLEALKRWNNDPQKIKFIDDQLEQLKGLYPKDWTKAAEKILRTFLNDKSLLVLIENFDWIMRGLDKKNGVIELAKLRDFVQQYHQISFIATSQSLIHALTQDRNPLYGFFNIIKMERLTFEESFSFIRKIALTEQDEELIPFLESHEGRGHLEAIHQFTRGNHRLLLVFFDFLKAEFRSNLSDVFLKSIDELKPYYASFIKNLAPQQQKIVQYLSLQRNPQKGSDIGRNCFLDKNTVSKQLSELQRLGYVSAVNEKGRDKYYEITEPLLRMCFEINEDRNGIIKLFVNFLGQLYTSEQLKEKYLHFNYLERFQPDPIRKQYRAEAKIYGMVKAQFFGSWELDEDAKKRLEGCCEPDETKKLIAEYSHKQSSPENSQIIEKLFKEKQWEKLVDHILRDLATEKDKAGLFNKLGCAYYELKSYHKSLDAFLKSIEIQQDDELVWFNIGLNYFKIGDFKKAINACQRCVELKPDYVSAWNLIGILYSEIGEDEKSIDSYLKALQIQPNYVKAWYNLGPRYYTQEKYPEAKNAYCNAIKYMYPNEPRRLADSYSGLIMVNIKLKEVKEALTNIDQIFSNPDQFDYLSKLEAPVWLLFFENSESENKEILTKLFNLAADNQKLEKLSALLTSVIFNLLKNHSQVNSERFEMLSRLFNELFKDKPEFTYPLRYLDIGIRYLVKEEKEAIYELSREERELFEKFTTERQNR